MKGNFLGDMTEGSTPIQIISGNYMVPEFRRSRSMQALPAQTVMVQKGMGGAHIVITTLSILLIAHLKNLLQNR
jgi:hypothetical protein